jgi:hypothetical protein
MNHLADAGNIDGATKAINGGLNGLADRTNRLHLCLTLGKAILPTPASTTILEDSMLLNKGQDAITPIALPDGIKSVRFFSDQPAQLAVDTRNHTPVTKLDLGNASAQVVTVPQAIHAFVAHRLDGGSNDISVAFSA